MTFQPIRIGSRKSPLAMAQAKIVEEKIRATFPKKPTEIIGIETTGDINQKSPLFEIGGKGVFIRELEVALIDKKIDIAVHSLKDVTANTADTLELTGFLAAESICDCLVSNFQYTIDTLPRNATVGTGSMRRKALLKMIRPDIITRDIRGNIGTRLNALHHLDAIMLSEVSMMRLHLDTTYAVLPPHQFIPAPGQGVICLETRINDPELRQLAKSISNANQYTISSLQLSFLRTVGFDCQLPLGMLTEIKGDATRTRLFRSSPDFSRLEIEDVGSSLDLAASELVKKATEWKLNPLY
ncbi:hydroxymethylbilane synthase [bacterium]|nr:hydroxymethylbilane synthase [bacterium]